MKQRGNSALSAFAEVGPVTDQTSPLNQTLGAPKESHTETGGNANFTFGIGYGGSW